MCLHNLTSSAKKSRGNLIEQTTPSGTVLRCITVLQRWGTAQHLSFTNHWR